MSQEFGGRSDKFGNEFERYWVVSLGLRILDGQATNIIWEPLGDQGDGVELKLSLADGRIEVHQCKIENGYHGNWTVSALNKSGVIAAMLLQLAKPDVDRFVFVSRDPCRVFGDLCDRVHKCNDDPADFVRNSLSSRKHKQEFSALCRLWGFESKQPEDVRAVMDLLRRVGFERGFWETGERRLLERNARWFAQGEGNAILDSLSRFLSESIGNQINGTDIRAHLLKNSLPPWDLLDDRSIFAAVERLQTQFRDSLSQVLPHNVLIRRPEADRLWNLVTADDGPRLVIIHGRAGHGKSGLLLDLARRLSAMAVPYLPVRLDSQRPESGDPFFQQVLGLTSHPVRCLWAVAGNKPAVLIIDQLDAVRWTAAHSEMAWEACREMIELALSRESFRVVVSCRSFDLEDDRRFKGWESSVSERAKPRSGVERLEVGMLHRDSLQTFTAEVGDVYSRLSPRQQGLLCVPLCLSLWWKLHVENQIADTFTTASDLMRMFWNFCRRKVALERGIPELQLAKCLDEVIEYLDREGRQDFPALLLDSSPGIVDAVQSLNLIQASAPGRLKFSHQSYLDYLVAERIIRDAIKLGHKPLDWLRSRDQSLYRREQLRQLLLLLREQLPDDYLNLMSGLLWDGGVRFHLRHLALSVLKSVDSPTNAEYTLLKKLLEDPSWHDHTVRIVLVEHQGWLERCASEGLFRAWLELGNDDQISEVIWLCRHMPRSLRTIADEMMAPYAALNDSKWNKRIDQSLPLDVGDDSNWAHEWRCRRLLTGDVTVELYSLSDEMPQQAERVAALLVAMFTYELDLIEKTLVGGETKGTTDRDRFDATSWRKIVDQISGAGHKSWEKLLQVALRSVALTKKVRRMQLLRRSKKTGTPPLFLPADDLWRLHRKGCELNQIGTKLLARTGRELISADDQRITRQLFTLEAGSSRSLNRLICEVLKFAPFTVADDAIQWLLQDVRRFAVGKPHSRKPQQPATDIITRFAAHCSDLVFRRLEAAVLNYHSPEEKYSVKIQLETLKDRGILVSNYYGRGQYAFLTKMPAGRLSPLAYSALATWRTKFGKLRFQGFSSAAKTHFAASSIPEDRKHLVSDANWLQIISTGWPTHRHRRRLDNPFAERSHPMFARDIGQQAKFNPTRFARLALRVPITAPLVYFECILRGLDQLKRPDNVPDRVPDWEPVAFDDIQALILRLLHIASQSSELTFAIIWLVRNRARERWDLRITDYIAHECVSNLTSETRTHTTIENKLNPWEHPVGVAVEALHQLIVSHSGLAIRYLPEICRSASDPDASVRVSATGLCNGLARWNPDSAVQLFRTVCDHIDDRVLTGLYVPDFINFAWKHYSDEVQELLNRMVGSRNPAASELGSYWVTGGALLAGRFVDLAGICRSGTIPQRVGSAAALVDLINKDEVCEIAAFRLAECFHDTDKPVSDKAAHVFHKNPELLDHRLGPKIALDFANSPAFLHDPSDLVRPLDLYRGNLVRYTPTVLAIIDHAAGSMAELIGDIQTRYALVARSLPNVLLKLYQQAEGPSNAEIRLRCLDAWDKLLESRIIGPTTLDQMDS